MNSIYQDKYYDHFSKRNDIDPPQFSRDENYMMRFNTQLPSYKFDENSLTIIYFKTGAGKLYWKDKRLIINDDKFVITNPSQGWEYINDEADYIDVLSFVVSDDFRTQFNFYSRAHQKQLLDTPFEKIEEDSFFLESPLNAKYYYSGKLLQETHRLSNRVGYEFLSPQELTIEILKSLYIDQVHGYKIAAKIESKKNSTKTETLRRLLIAREFIHDNIKEQIRIEDLSKVSSLSKFHLYSSFKNVFGKTPHQYINSLRLTKAKEFLRDTNFSVSEVYSILGFTDLPSFSKMFKKAYGISPSSYNKSNQFLHKK
ncbi:helix-turn-helix domain-containing protein [Aquimarina algiphila]|uniref:helix-turn-helix domain-containing protein n=1 Tax=Aquimarina algiphila TaxID=2047982 RepID=UPI0024907E52|nr:AraC family transcriptional regulator [Aquimarina algiphila]